MEVEVVAIRKKMKEEKEELKVKWQKMEKLKEDVIENAAWIKVELMEKMDRRSDRRSDDKSSWIKKVKAAKDNEPKYWDGNINKFVEYGEDIRFWGGQPMDGFLETMGKSEAMKDKEMMDYEKVKVLLEDEEYKAINKELYKMLRKTVTSAGGKKFINLHWMKSNGFQSWKMI